MQKSNLCAFAKKEYSTNLKNVANTIASKAIKEIGALKKASSSSKSKKS